MIPELDLDEDLSEEPLEDDSGIEEMPSDVDPMFAADVSEAFPDMDDAQIAALQRAILGLTAGGGQAPPMGGMGF
jgi:hypothetical protein